MAEGAGEAIPEAAVTEILLAVAAAAVVLVVVAAAVHRLQVARAALAEEADRIHQVAEEADWAEVCRWQVHREWAAVLAGRLRLLVRHLRRRAARMAEVMDRAEDLPAEGWRIPEADCSHRLKVL